MTSKGSSIQGFWLAIHLLVISISVSHAQTTQTAATSGATTIRRIAFSPDGRLMAAAVGEPSQVVGRLVVWDWKARREMYIHQESSGIYSVIFSPSGQHLAFGMLGPTAKLLTAETGAVVREFSGHEGHVRSVAFVSNEMLATGSYDKTVRLWETATGKEIVKLGEHNKELRDIAASPDGRWLLSGATSPDVRLWNIAERKQAAEFQPSAYICPTVGFSRDGTLFLTGRWDGTLRIQETAKHTLRAAIRATCRGFDLAPDNRTLVVCEDRPSVKVFRLALFLPTKDLEQQIDKYIATWQDDDYQKRERASAELIALGLVAESQLHEATKSNAAETRIRARKTREIILSPKPADIDVGHQTNVGAVQFSPDGKLVASGDADGVVKLWDPTTGKVSTEFRVSVTK